MSLKLLVAEMYNNVLKEASMVLSVQCVCLKECLFFSNVKGHVRLEY